MVEALYNGCTCSKCAAIRDASTPIKLDGGALEKALREIYDEEVDPSEGEFPRDLYESTREVFSRASAEGFAGSKFDITKKEDFLEQYTNSVDVFSAFRVHKYAEVMATMLHDADGNLRTFEDWRKATEPIQSHFNRSWLETEYSTAVLRAEQAANWQQFESEKDVLPNLKWMPTSSAEPREEHAVFWREGLTLPVNDTFWDEHHPGDLWNCKCWLEQTDGKATEKKEMPTKKEMPKAAEGLKSNPGRVAEMFDRSHPYFPQPSSCVFLQTAKGKDKRAKCPGNCVTCPHGPKT